MTRRTSDSRSRHKSTKESAIEKRGGTRSRHLQHQQLPRHELQEPYLNATSSQAAHDDKAPPALQEQHPANCECWKLHPGLFLPESLLQSTNDPPHWNGNSNNDAGRYHNYPNSWNDEDDDYLNGKA